MTQVDSTAATPAGLSQIERVTSIFSAPSRTFDDIRDGRRSWWLPFVILAIVSYLFFAAVSTRIGMEQTVRNQIQMSPKAQQQMASASPEQAAKQISISVAITKGVFYVAPVFGLLYAAVIGAVLLGTINFAFGGRATFSNVFAVLYYAWLPGVIQVVLGIMVLWFQPPEQFNIKNFAPTNPAALFLDPASSNPALYALCTCLDVTTIWTLVLVSIGLATVAGLKRKTGYIVVFGWWAVVVIFKVGFAAAFG
jgi:hypothetical protein